MPALRIHIALIYNPGNPNAIQRDYASVRELLRSSGCRTEDVDDEANAITASMPEGFMNRGAEFMRISLAWAAGSSLGWVHVFESEPTLPPHASLTDIGFTIDLINIFNRSSYYTLGEVRDLTFTQLCQLTHNPDKANDVRALLAARGYAIRGW